MEGADLPKGWFKEEVIRKSGLSAGKTDIYYHGPDGKKYRSKPQIARELGSDCDLTAFDFKAGRMISQPSIVRRAKGKKTPYDFSKTAKHEANLALPVRQTASIFKQPVQIIRSHPDSQVRHDLKHGNPDNPPPRQLFWEKSLSDVKCGSLDEEDLNSLVMPRKIKGIGPDLTTENLLQSIAAALHLNNHPVVGQSQPVVKFAKNPTVHINTNQPLVQQVAITEDDIKQQEVKVGGARKKVEELLAAIEKSSREALLKDERPLSAAPSESDEVRSERAATPTSSAATPTSSTATPTPAATPSADEVTEGKSRKRKASPTRNADHDNGPSNSKESKQEIDKPEQQPEETGEASEGVAEVKDVEKPEASTNEPEKMEVLQEEPAKDEVLESSESADVNKPADASENSEQAASSPAEETTPKEGDSVSAPEVSVSADNV